MICTEIDDWLRDQMDTGYKAIWEATLNDGTKAYQDDGRNPDLESAWIRLKKYCQKNNLHIVGLCLRFRNNVINLPGNKEGYYFIRGFLGQFGYQHPKRKISGFETAVIGYLEDNIIKTKTYRCPELTEIDSGERNVKDNLECLI